MFNSYFDITRGYKYQRVANNESTNPNQFGFPGLCHLFDIRTIFDLRTDTIFELNTHLGCGQ